MLPESSGSFLIKKQFLRFNHLRSKMDQPDISNTEFEPLTSRELEVLRLLAEGLSNKEIGARLSIRVMTVKWYNQQIFGKLDVRSRLQAVKKAWELDVFADAADSKSQKHPQTPTYLNPFIGRTQEINNLMKLTESRRLVTVTGTGGVGKTRLCVEFLNQVAESYPDGAFFVSLGAITDEDQVVSAIAQVLDIQLAHRSALIDAIIQFCSRKKLLIVIDNFEHLVTAGPILSEIVSSTKHLHMVITSRVAMGLPRFSGG